MAIDLSQFRPGRGYKIREYIASGAWKSAFKGSAPGNLEEVALLCYKSGSRGEAASDASKLIRLDPSHLYASYLANLYAIFPGEDGRVWIVEELLSKALNSLVRLYDVGKLTRVARDLSRALVCIHEQQLVHRDIKLDNCGIDRYGQAKIFDLGSLVTDPGAVQCTILTRPPEVISNESEDAYTKAGDVWALGATLFALFTGNYPFVFNQEIIDRGILNEKVIAGEVSSIDADAQKKILNEKVARRSSADGAEAGLWQQIDSHFGGQVASLLKIMLSFEPENRPVAKPFRSEME